MPIIRATKNKDTGFFSVINNSGCRNKCLPPEIAGILWRLLSMPDKWDFTVTWLKKEYGYGPGKAATIRQVLMDFGYLFMPEESKTGLGRGNGFGFTRELYENPYTNPHGFKFKNAYDELGQVKPEFVNWYKANYKRNGEPRTTENTTTHTTVDDNRGTEIERTNLVRSKIEPYVNTEEFTSSDKDVSKKINTEEGIQSPLGASSPLQEAEETITYKNWLYPYEYRHAVTDVHGVYKIYDCEIPLSLFHIDVAMAIKKDPSFDVGKLARLTADDIDSLQMANRIDGCVVRYDVFPNGLPQRFKDAIDITTIPKALSLAA